MSRALVSSLWRSYTTLLRGSCTLLAPVPTRSLHLAASPLSSECHCSVTVPTRRPSMPPRYCDCGSVLPSHPWDRRSQWVTHLEGLQGTPPIEGRGSTHRLREGSRAEKHWKWRGAQLELLTEVGSCWEPQRDSITKSHGSNSDLCSVCSHASWSLVLRDDFYKSSIAMFL